MSEYRVGLIGFDDLQSSLLQELERSPYFKVVAAAEIPSGVRGRIPSGVKMFRSAGELIEKANLDVVSICQVVQERYSSAIIAAEKGVNIVYEPPIHEEPRKVEEVIRKFEGSKAFAVPIDELLFDNVIQQLVQSVLDNAVGLPIVAYCRRFNRKRSKPEKLIYLAAPFITLSRRLMNSEPVEVYASLKNEEASLVNVNFENKTSAVICLGYRRLETYPIDDVTIDVIGTDGVLTVKPDNAALRVYSEVKQFKEYWEEPGVSRLVKHLASRLRGGEEIVSIRDDLAVAKVISASLQSNSKKECVSI